MRRSVGLLWRLRIATLVVLVRGWKDLNQRARSWLIFVWAAFLTTSFGLLTIINPGVDKQNQEINIKFFAPAHGFFAMMIGYGMALAAAWVLLRWREISAGGHAGAVRGAAGISLASRIRATCVSATNATTISVTSSATVCSTRAAVIRIWTRTPSCTAGPIRGVLCRPT